MPDGIAPLPNTTPAESASTTSPASAYALALLAGFVAAGVADIVVAPGSRSQALALAAAELERVGALHLHVRIDERSAGFFALGLAVESSQPTVVITTSGTAVANLHPAVLEAHHSGVPLIICSADRPIEMRGIGANQTTHQRGIFAGTMRLERDVPAPIGEKGEADAASALAARAVAASLGQDEHGAFLAEPGPGPVHLNVQLREPLSSALDAAAVEAAVASARLLASSRLNSPFGTPGNRGKWATRDSDRGGPNAGAFIERGPRTVVVAGADAGPDAEEFARSGGWPLLAEVTSGARFGPNLVVAARELLREPGFGDEVKRVIVFGHPTLTREVPALVQRDAVEAIVVAASGIEWYDPGHRVRRFERAVRVEPGDATDAEREWLARWTRASRVLLAPPDEPAPLRSSIGQHGHVEDPAAQREYVRAQLAQMRAPVSRRMLVDAVWAATWPHDRLVFGASRLIRDADRVVPGRRIRAHANRGLAGIDGTVATALGIAVASSQADATGDARAGASGVTRALIGDLTLLHDVGSLLIGAGEQRPRLQVIVGNDGGGTIFDALEVAEVAPADAFDRVQYTPQQVDFAALAAAYGWEYRRAATRGELDEALGTAVTGPTLVEVPLPR